MFCEVYDTMPSVSSRSAFLLDAIISIGCRAQEGFTSLVYRQLQARLREHLSRMLIKTETPAVEDIQAITLMAAYSENGLVQIALALRFCLQLGLPKAVDELVARRARPGVDVADEAQIYRLARVWHCVCNFELLYGKPSVVRE